MLTIVTVLSIVIALFCWPYALNFAKSFSKQRFTPAGPYLIAAGLVSLPFLLIATLVFSVNKMLFASVTANSRYIECDYPNIGSEGLILPTADGKGVLHLPRAANVTLTPYPECNKVHSFTQTIGWYKGKLLTSSAGGINVPNTEVSKVEIFYAGLDSISSRRRMEDWRYESPIRHKTYPLEYYPRFSWETEVGPAYPYQKYGAWGIIGTRNPLNGKPIVVSCTIRRTDAIENSEVSGDCRGHAYGTKNGKVLSARFIVFPPDITEIDAIVNSLNPLLESYIEG
ncbi:hypothetical protein ACUHMQ_06570 [Chitinimonas sp. PSY-7]|uniref:hypothetical protein n=1 Tax=Chitinimonas sp. PSY-7 TaxID=3459088 RepID=UPI0040400975